MSDFIYNSHKTFNKNLGEAQVKITSSDGSNFVADTMPLPIQNINGKEGAQYKNSNGPPEKFNYYIFNGQEENIIVSDLSSIWAELSIDKNTAFT